MAEIGVVIVHYRCPELLDDAVGSLFADGLEPRVVVVDNDPEPVHRWRHLPVHYVTAGRNLGYAGGINLGLAQLDTPWLMVMNPDLRLFPGCLRRLVETLEQGADVVGPRQWWDQERTIHLPPPEPRHLAWELLARSPWPTLARFVWGRGARPFFAGSAPLESPRLSGSLLAFSRAAWGRIGEWDSNYQLYFEETDWLLRAWRAGLRLVFEPRAEVLHLYNQSASQQTQAAAWFAQSFRRFARCHYGAFWGDWLAGRGPYGPDPRARWLDGPAIPLGNAGWVEISQSPRGFPFALARVDGHRSSYRLPDEVYRRLAPGAYFLRARGGPLFAFQKRGEDLA